MIAADIRQEIVRGIRALCTGDVPIPLPTHAPDARTTFEQHLARASEDHVVVTVARNTEAARRILRIEVDYNTERDIMRHLYETGSLPRDYHDRVGPHQFDGVDLYVVARLPAPGWRVINPFVKAR